MMEQNNKLDKTIVKRLKTRIILMESDNLRTKRRSDTQMISAIKSKIEEEVKCCFNR